MINDMEVTAEAGLLPSDESIITLGFDRASGILVAYVG